MQELAVQPEPAAGRGAPVAGVSADRMADRREVRADLMGAARLEAKIEERRPRKALAHLEVRDRRAPARGAGGHHVAPGAVAPQRRRRWCPKRRRDGPPRARCSRARSRGGPACAPARRGPPPTSPPPAGPTCRGRAGARCRPAPGPRPPRRGRAEPRRASSASGPEPDGSPGRPACPPRAGGRPRRAPRSSRPPAPGGARRPPPASRTRPPPSGGSWTGARPSTVTRPASIAR